MKFWTADLKNYILCVLPLGLNKVQTRGDLGYIFSVVCTDQTGPPYPFHPTPTPLWCVCRRGLIVKSGADLAPICFLTEIFSTGIERCCMNEVTVAAPW
jgi:hypothetical protein